jgi:5-methylcytosine-specific restriction endonuclease McrA
MSEQRISNVFREALWETYRKKCFHCSGELLLADMEVDHILPEFLVRDSKKRIAIFKRVGIDGKFSILGFENLAPSCPGCNSKKGETILADGSLAIHLAKIRDKIPALEEALQKQKSSRDLENTLRLIQRSIDQGKFTPDELMRQLDFLRRVPDGIKGSSPSAPPPSPEVSRLDMDIWDPSRILFTRHAMAQLQERNMGIHDIYLAIYRSIHSSSADMKREPNGHYVVRGRDNLRVVFELTADAVTIQSVFKK